MMDTDDYEVRLPRLIGSRESVRALVSAAGDLTGRTLILNARDLRSASPSAADEFVKATLVRGDAASLVVAGAGSDFVRDLEESANACGVSDRVAHLSLR